VNIIDSCHSIMFQQLILPKILLNI